MSHESGYSRRRVIQLGSTGAVVLIGGCLGGGDGGGSDGSDGGSDGSDGGGSDGSDGGSDGSDGSDGGMDGGADDFMSAAEQLGLGENTQQRRIENARNNWSVEDRQDTPDRQNDSTWTDSEAFQTALEAEAWRPPEGWDETAAGDVDSITILNHGAANMEFDPATLAAHEYFTEVTGIDIETIEIGVEQATQREQQVLSSEQGSPQAFNVDGALVPEFVQREYLEVTDALYPSGGFEPYIPALENLVTWDIDQSREGAHTYGYPNIVEASLGHLRPDLVEEQGLDPATYTEGEWTWDELEDLMAAFEDADQFGYAYYAGDAIYLSYSFRELLFQQGGRMVQDDGTVRLDTDAAIRVVQKMREWREKGWVPGDVLSYGEGSIVDLFTSGQLAFATGFSDFVPSALDQFGEDGSQYLPVVPPAANAGPNPTQAGLVDPNTTSINRFAGRGEKLAAMLYGDLKLSYPVQWWEYTYEGNMSYMDSVYTDAADAEFTPYAGALGDAIENGVLELFPGVSAVFQQMLSPVQRAIQGSVSPEAAMTQVQGFVDEEINN